VPALAANQIKNNLENMGFGHSHDACFITLKNDSRLTKKPRIRERNTRNENFETC